MLELVDKLSELYIPLVGIYSSPSAIEYIIRTWSGEYMKYYIAQYNYIMDCEVH